MMDDWVSVFSHFTQYFLTYGKKNPSKFILFQIFGTQNTFSQWSMSLKNC